MRDNRKILVETETIKIKRIEYLRNILKFRAQGRPIVYIDETYIHSSHTQPKSWYDQTNLGLHKPVSKGERLIILHAGGEMGFINDALLIFKSGKLYLNL